MNQHTPMESLPHLSTESISRIEDAVFAEITAHRQPSAQKSARARSRRRRWFTGLGVAAAFVAGLLVAPPILGIVSNSEVTSVSDTAAYSSGGSGETVQTDIDSSALVAAEADQSGSREIIQTARATVRVPDIRNAADEIAVLADERGGYVESTDIQTATDEDAPSEPAPHDPGYGWISIRVPSADLSEVVKELASSGEVLASSVSKQDVTSAAIDLRARVDATRASVERLTELMSSTATVSDLLEAEVALSERQAQLESYEQQLAALEDQVEMSSLHVELTKTSAPTAADPTGFGDGLLAGWNGLIVSLNAVVIALGFLLPWLAVAAVVVVVIWLVRRRRRAAPPQPE